MITAKNTVSRTNDLLSVSEFKCLILKLNLSLFSIRFFRLQSLYFRYCYLDRLVMPTGSCSTFILFDGIPCQKCLVNYGKVYPSRVHLWHPTSSQVYSRQLAQLNWTWCAKLILTFLWSTLLPWYNCIMRCIISFVTAQQLVYLARLLSHSAHRPLMLLGEPGCGKTSLAREYVRSVVCEFGKASTESVLTMYGDRQVLCINCFSRPAATMAVIVSSPLNVNKHWPLGPPLACVVCAY